MARSFEGKVVIITGASSGLGEGLARALGRAGAKLGLLARREEQLASLAADIEAGGSRAEWAAVDVCDREAVEAAILDIQEDLGPCDILVANAGMNLHISSPKLDAKKVAKVMEVNYLGAVYAIGAVVGDMVQRGNGHIVVTSSVASFRGLPGMGAYSASKAALSTFCESLRIDLIHTGVQVTTIHPGFVRTPMTDEAKFTMPFLVELDDAVVTMMRGIGRRQRRIDFPWPMVWLVKLVRWCPDFIYDGLGRLINKRVPVEKRGAAD